MILLERLKKQGIFPLNICVALKTWFLRDWNALNRKCTNGYVTGRESAYAQEQKTARLWAVGV